MWLWEQYGGEDRKVGKKYGDVLEYVKKTYDGANAINSTGNAFIHQDGQEIGVIKFVKEV